MSRSVIAISILVAGLGALPARSQGPPVLRIRLQRTEAVGMRKNQPIATALISDPRVCRVQPIQNDSTRILVTALTPGLSRLTLEDEKKNTEVIDIVVTDDDLRKTPATPLRPGETEIALLDGSVLRVAALFDKIDVATSFGKLSVPREDIRAIEFGRHLPDGADEEIRTAILALGSTDARQRDRAGKTLIDLGPFSYAAVCEAAVVDDLEVSQRALRIAKELEANHSKQDLKVGVKDRIVTAEFTIVGVIQTRHLKARSPWLGELNLPVAGMRTLRAAEAGKER